MNNTTKLVAQQEEWNRVAGELEAENLKLMSYDNTLVALCGDVRGKKVLDYGAGPGVLALAIKKLGGESFVYDINSDLRAKAAAKIGAAQVYATVAEMPKNNFDVIICNLVLCIVPEDEVRRIVANLRDEVNADGRVFVGFCNPQIFHCKESQLDFRFATGAAYEENHDYKKIKKEGGYEIIESHRPNEWYENIYRAAGFDVVARHYTPEYELNGEQIKDFIIFELRRAA